MASLVGGVLKMLKIRKITLIALVMTKIGVATGLFMCLSLGF